MENDVSAREGPWSSSCVAAMPLDRCSAHVRCALQLTSGADSDAQHSIVSDVDEVM